MSNDFRRIIRERMPQNGKRREGVEVFVSERMLNFLIVIGSLAVLLLVLRLTL